MLFCLFPPAAMVEQRHQPAEQSARRLAAEIDVLGNVHVTGEGQVLVNHLDSEIAGIARTVEPDRPAIEDQASLARRVQA